MSVINGIFLYNGVPQNGATAKLWEKAGFASPPQQDDAEPDPGYQVGGSLTTGTTYGADGAFRWTSIDPGEYYASVYYGGHRAFLYFEADILGDVLTTEGDLLVRGSSALERLAKGSDGQFLKMVSGEPAWADSGMAEDTIDEGVSSNAVTNSGTCYYRQVSQAATTETDLATVTDTYDSSSIAVGVGYLNGDVGNSSLKVRFYMDGVEMEETSGGGASEHYLYIYTKALSGSATSKISIYNSSGGAITYYPATGIFTGDLEAAIVAVGSIKV